MPGFGAAQGQVHLGGCRALEAHEVLCLVLEPDQASGVLQAALAEARPRLVILDVMLPGRDGLSACAALRRRDASLPILILSARDTEIDRVVGLESGADEPSGCPASQQSDGRWCRSQRPRRQSRSRC